MEMNVTISGLTPGQVQALSIYAAGLTTAPQPIAETKTKAPKKEAAPAKVEEKTEEPIDLGFDTTPTPAPAAKKLTLEDVIGKLQEYAGKHGRDNAGKILGKFGVKSVRDLKEDSYEKFIKELA